MTPEEKAKIIEMRNACCSYRDIADALNVTKAKVQTYCVRHNLGGTRAPVGRRETASICENCRKPIEQQAGRKHKRFCCDACRMAWWSKHRNLIQHKTIHTFTCAECGCSFSVYGSASRKYCSASCYAKSRRRKKA